MEASLSVCCHPASWGTSGRVLQVQSSSPNPLFLVHVPQPISHTRTMMTSKRPRKVLVPKERLLAPYSTVNVLRVVFLNAFPLETPEQFGVTMTQPPGITVSVSSLSSESASPRKLARMLSSVRVRHAAPGEEHDTARGASGGGAKGGGDGGCDAEGGDGGSADREPGAQTPSNVTDPTFLSHSESRAKGRVVQLQSFAPVHVPQPVSHASLTVRSSALNACSPIARSPSSYSTVNVAKSDCANPCFATAVQPAVMTAHPPGMVPPL